MLLHVEEAALEAGLVQLLCHLLLSPEHSLHKMHNMTVAASWELG